MIGVYVVVAVGLSYLAGYVHAHLEATLNERESTSRRRENLHRSETRKHISRDMTSSRSLRVLPGQRTRDRKPW